MRDESEIWQEAKDIEDGFYQVWVSRADKNELINLLKETLEETWLNKRLEKIKKAIGTNNIGHNPQKESELKEEYNNWLENADELDIIGLIGEKELKEIWEKEITTE